MSVLQFYSLFLGMEMCLCNTFSSSQHFHAPPVWNIYWQDPREIWILLQWWTGECVLAQSWTESHSICHRLLWGCYQIGYLRAGVLWRHLITQYVLMKALAGDMICLYPSKKHVHVSLCVSVRGFLVMSFRKQSSPPLRTKDAIIFFFDSRCHGNSMTVASSPRSNRHWWVWFALLRWEMSTHITLSSTNNIILRV